jgi:hypothetical protein
MYPTSQPLSQPTTLPTSQPSSQPSLQPASKPTRQPTTQPSNQPSSQPILKPTAQPTRQPSLHPSSEPSSQPSLHPSSEPSSQPTSQPTTYSPPPAAEALSSGEIAGIVIGVLVAVCGIAVFCYFYFAKGSFKIAVGDWNDLEKGKPTSPAVVLKNKATNVQEKIQVSYRSDVFHSVNENHMKVSTPDSTSTLNFLSIQDSRTVDISSSFPMVSEIVGWLSLLINNGEFRKYFEYDLTEDTATLRATTVLVAAHLIDLYVRSFIIFSQNPKDLTPLFTSIPKGATGKEFQVAARTLIDDCWREMYSGLLSDPAIILQKQKILSRIPSILQKYNSALHADAVIDGMKELFSKNKVASSKLAEIITALALSPKISSFVPSSQKISSLDKSIQQVVAESGEGKVRLLILIFPQVLLGDGSNPNKALVYRING